MSEVLGTYSGEGLLAGTEIEVTRANGKGFTALRVVGPRAREIRDCVRAVAEDVADRNRRAAESARAGGYRRPRHVVATSIIDCGSASAVCVYGRLRQTRDVVEIGLFAYSSRLSTEHPGVPVPLIRLKPPEAS